MRASAQAEKNHQRHTARPVSTWQTKIRPFLAKNRLGAVAQGKRKEVTDNSPQVTQLKERIDMINSGPSVLPQDPLAASPQESPQSSPFRRAWESGGG